MIVVRRYPQGPRVWIFGQRVHHGTVGIVAAAILRRNRYGRLIAAAVVLHDRHDWRVWFVRERTPGLD